MNGTETEGVKVQEILLKFIKIRKALRRHGGEDDIVPKFDLALG